MDPHLAAALATAGGVTDRADLAAAGVRPGAVRWARDRGAVLAVGRWLVVDPESWAGRTAVDRHRCLVVAALRRAPAGTVVAGGSAAALWGLALESGPPDAPVLLRGRDARRTQYGRGAGPSRRRRAWLEPDEMSSVDGVPVTSLVRTAVDMARSIDEPWGLAVMDAVRSRGVAIAALLDAVDRHRFDPGSRTAARVARWSDPRAESPLESVARGVMLVLGLPEPDLQVTIGGTDGPRYRVDLLVREFATVVEVDGKVKYGDAAATERSWQDKRRRDRLLGRGYEVERFVAADAYHRENWGRRLVRTFERACTRHGRPAPSLDLPWYR